MLGRVLGRLDHDAADGAGDGAQLAADALLEAVRVAVQDVTSPLTRGHRPLPFGVLDRDHRPGVVLEGRQHRLDQVVGSERDVTQGHGSYLSAATTTTAVTIIMIRERGRSD